MQAAVPGQAAHLQRRRGCAAAGPAAGLRRKGVRDVAPDHHLDDLRVALAAGREGRDVAAVAEHRAVVGQLGDLVHAVRDVDDGQALVAQPLEQRVDALARRPRSAPRSPRRGSGSSARAPAPWRSPPSAGATAAGCRTGASGWMSSAPARASAASAMRRCALRSMRPKRRGGLVMQMLSATLRSGISDSSWKMQAMPADTASCGMREAALRALQHDAALVGLHHAGHHLDQRRLAGAVLAEHGVDAPRRAGEARAARARARRHSAWRRRPAGRTGAGPSPPSRDGAPSPAVCRSIGSTGSFRLDMMSVAFRVTPQGGKSLVVKKLSVSSGK